MVSKFTVLAKCTIKNLKAFFMLNFVSYDSTLCLDFEHDWAVCLCSTLCFDIFDFFFTELDIGFDFLDRIGVCFDCA